MKQKEADVNDAIGILLWKKHIADKQMTQTTAMSQSNRGESRFSII